MHDRFLNKESFSFPDQTACAYRKTKPYTDCLDFPFLEGGARTLKVEDLGEVEVTCTSYQYVYVLMRVNTGGNNNVFLNRTWLDYVEGFSGTGGIWLGLEPLQKILGTTESYRLLVQVTSFSSGLDSYNYYGAQLHGGDQYTLMYDTADGNSDPLLSSRGSAFSAPDRDNDEETGLNCAEDYGGGWW